MKSIHYPNFLIQKENLFVCFFFSKREKGILVPYVLLLISRVYILKQRSRSTLRFSRIIDLSLVLLIHCFFFWLRQNLKQYLA